MFLIRTDSKYIFVLFMYRSCQRIVMIIVRRHLTIISRAGFTKKTIRFRFSLFFVTQTNFWQRVCMCAA